MASERSNSPGGENPHRGGGGASGIPVPTIEVLGAPVRVPDTRGTPGLHRRYDEREIEQLRDLRDLVTRGFPPAEAVRLLRSGGAAPSR